MTKLQQFEELVRKARREPAPTPDVSAAVAARLHAGAVTPAAAAWPFAFAAVCTGAAVVLGYFGLQAWSVLNHPWTGSMLAVSAWWLL